MTSADFLDLLCKSDFGKIICINLYRSGRIGTLKPDAIKRYLESCIQKFEDHYADPKKAIDPRERIALKQATEWNTRAGVVKANLYTTPAFTDNPTQFATVLTTEVLTRDAEPAKNLSYSSRNLTDKVEFDSVLKEWLVKEPSFIFGKMKDYFWIASPIDLSDATVSKRAANGIAQLHVDLFGLSHLGNPVSLVRAVIPMSLTPRGPFRELFRPTGLDGIANPAFRSAADHEVAAPAKGPGQTVDLGLAKVATSTSIDGQYEWLAKPMTVRATSVAWEFLGISLGGPCVNDPAFHSSVYSHLSRTTPLSDARGYLEKL